MKLQKIKILREKNSFTQDDMAQALSISQNAYSLIENGITRLIDNERILIIAKKLNVEPIELGLLDGLGITQNFHDKVENGYIHHMENLNANNRELTKVLQDELQKKNDQIENLIQQINLILKQNAG